MMIRVKTPAQIMAMREAGRITAIVLEEIRAAIQPGVSTYDLDQIAAKRFKQFGARPAFLGYPPNGEHPFPGNITACINNELVHGIPSKDRIIQEGDLVSIDTACHYMGFVGDAAFTVAVGPVSPPIQKLLAVTEQALKVGIAAAQVGNETKDIAKAIQTYVESQGMNVAREYTGHGVGELMHEEPAVPNWWPGPKEQKRKDRRFQSQPLKQGMTLALEPMVTMGNHETLELDDHWTVIMKDGALCAHCEHTIALVGKEPLILTLP
jgi:methionyl aminopeptidase